MASHEITALQCPSCGSSNTGPTKPLAFGAEFTCAKCGGTSVLIINRALLPVDTLHRSGDQVCAVCGRVAAREARFCQEGHKLVRSCINSECGREFAAHHQRCDYCGWPQNVKPGTQSGFELKLDNAIEELAVAISGNSNTGAEMPLKKIMEIYQATGQGKQVVALIVELLKVKKLRPNEESWALHVLGRMGADAVEAVPFLTERIKDLTDWYNLRNYWGVLAMIIPQEMLLRCRAMFEASGRNLNEGGDIALSIVDFIGKPAIPMLREFCGVFSGRRGEYCQYRIDEISKRGKMVFWVDDGLLTTAWSSE